MSNRRQEVADWFSGRLRQITKAAGYSFDVDPARVYTDADPPEEDPAVPRVVYDDATGSWSAQVHTDARRLLTITATVEVTIKIVRGAEKAASRMIEEDIIRACSLRAMDDDRPLCVSSIYPANYARAERVGSYQTVTVFFTVQVDDSPAH